MLSTNERAKELEWKLYERGYIILNEHECLTLYNRKTNEDIPLDQLSENDYSLYLQLDFILNNEEDTNEEEN